MKAIFLYKVTQIFLFIISQDDNLTNLSQDADANSEQFNAQSIDENLVFALMIFYSSNLEARYFGCPVIL